MTYAPTRFESKEAAVKAMWANYESDDFPAASTEVARVLLIGPTPARAMGVEPGFYINLELDRAGL